MAEWMMSSEAEDLMSGNEEDLMSGDEEDLMEENEVDVEDVSATSIPDGAQNINIRLISQQTLLPSQREDLRKVMDILVVKEQFARTLLIHYRWDFARLFDAFVERGNDWLFSQAGIAIRPKSTNSLFVTIYIVCAEQDLKEEDTTMMNCGHTFCNVCWTKHFPFKINEGQSKRIKCMAPDCNVICDEDIIRKLVTVNALVLPIVEMQFELKEMFALWDKKCQDDSETLNWITVNTKLCPKCGKNVNKDGGCNLVSCVCGQNFCWLCGGATGGRHTQTSIEGHSCGRYKEDEGKDIEKAARDLKRYTHYYSRWKAHKDSLELETKQRKLLEENILDFESKESRVSDYRWLLNTLERLFTSRRALAYSYAFAFHMFGDDILRHILTPTQKEMKQNLFEDQQQQLEGTVERLSKIIEGPSDQLSVMANRTQVMDLTCVVDTMCRRMYEFIQNDLVRDLHLKAHPIATYNSKGVHILSI
eukprot:PITA_18669